MKRTYSFRINEETIKKLDRIVKIENENLERKGLLVFKYNRTNMIELLIDMAFNMTKKGQSIQDLKNGKGDTGEDEKNG